MKQDLQVGLKPYEMKMTNTIFLYLFLIIPAVSHAQETITSSDSSLFTEVSVKEIMKKVADWQMANPPGRHKADWTNGALYAGFVEWAAIAGNEVYYQWLKDIGEKCNWTYFIHDKPSRRYHADDYCVGQMYIELYRKYKDKRMIKPIKSYLDQIMNDPAMGPLTFGRTGNYSSQQRWSWCDALFMAPPVWAKIGNVSGKKKYFDFMFSEYKATTDLLFDKDENLFFRDTRYFDKREANQEKVFWGRGNGWVFAGLPLILRELPDKYENKEFFITLYQKMAARIISLQDTAGYWHASLLDPDSYPQPEMSATGFFVSGLAWGINNGYLERDTYLPHAIKGWEAMVQSVWPDGKVGFVQPVGSSPVTVTKDMTDVYGVGAFLLGGVEIWKMLE
jgi:unsaturated rhamnogalacturonyl hydrolase